MVRLHIPTFERKTRLSNVIRTRSEMQALTGVTARGEIARNSIPEGLRLQNHPHCGSTGPVVIVKTSYLDETNARV